MDDLTPSEAAFFESGGEKPIDETPAPAATPEATPAADPVKDAPAPAAAEVPAEGGDGQKVPLSVLMEEKGRRKAAEREAREFREQLQRLSGRLDVLTGGQAQPEEGNGKLDVVKQPIEALQRVVEYIEQDQAQKTTQGQYDQFTNAINAAERAFAATTPDFADALAFLQTSRLAELRAIGYDDTSAAQVIGQEAIGISSMAMQQQANPAERFYALAKARGYTGKAAPAAAAAPDPTIAAAAAMSAAAGKLENAAKLQAAAKSLGAGGASGADGLTLEAMAAMSDDELSNMKDSQWAKMWGG